MCSVLFDDDSLKVNVYHCVKLLEFSIYGRPFVYVVYYICQTLMKHCLHKQTEKTV